MNENKEKVMVTPEDINRRLDDIEYNQIHMMEALKMLMIMEIKGEITKLDEFMAELTLEGLNKISRQYNDRKYPKDKTEVTLKEAEELFDKLKEMLEK